MWTPRFAAVVASVHTNADRRSQQNWCFRGVNADRRGCEPTQQPLQTEVSTSGTGSWRCPESPQTSRYDQIIHHNDQLPRSTFAMRYAASPLRPTPVRRCIRVSRYMPVFPDTSFLQVSSNSGIWILKYLMVSGEQIHGLVKVS